MSPPSSASSSARFLVPDSDGLRFVPARSFFGQTYTSLWSGSEASPSPVRFRRAVDRDGETETGRNWPLPIEQPGPAVRIHLAPPKSRCEPIPVVASFRGLNENRVIGKVHARTPDHADKSRRGNHKKCACGGDAPAPPAPKRAHMSSPCRRQPISSWHLIQEMSRIDASILDSRWPLEIRGGIRGNRRAARWRPHCPASHGDESTTTRSRPSKPSCSALWRLPVRQCWLRKSWARRPPIVKRIPFSERLGDVKPSRQIQLGRAPDRYECCQSLVSLMDRRDDPTEHPGSVTLSALVRVAIPSNLPCCKGSTEATWYGNAQDTPLKDLTASFQPGRGRIRARSPSRSLSRPVEPRAKPPRARGFT